MKVKKIIIVLITIILIVIIKFQYRNITKTEELKTEILNIGRNKYYEIHDFEIINKDIYLALNDTKKIEYKLNKNSNYEEKIIFTSNNTDIATVDKFGIITARNIGKTSININIKDEIKSINVTVTNLITKIPENYNKQKKLLTCGIYTEEENNLLDAILKNRVIEAGYQSRAGVVAAARFITLEFPYKIGYFSENGRLTTYGYSNYVDGEGRYYHQGLYLHKSRFKDIKKSMYGPNIWGCEIYSYVSKGIRRNGFDCSGFIAWILLNGGYDSGDIGAGISSVIIDMTDLGKKINLVTSLKNNSLKTGDLLSGPNNNGGHIAMIIGIKDNNYYVAECLWGNGEYGAIVRTYTKSTINDYFKWHINMDNYYKKDGNYEEHWI